MEYEGDTEDLLTTYREFDPVEVITTEGEVREIDVSGYYLLHGSDPKLVVDNLPITKIRIPDGMVKVEVALCEHLEEIEFDNPFKISFLLASNTTYVHNMQTLFRNIYDSKIHLTDIRGININNAVRVFPVSVKRESDYNVVWMR